MSKAVLTKNDLTRHEKHRERQRLYELWPELVHLSSGPALELPPSLVQLQAGRSVWYHGRHENTDLCSNVD
jgi:hypothetical protein